MSTGWVAAGRMGKFPVRLKEVVYTVSPFEVSVLSGLWKDLPEKISRKFREVRARRGRQRRSVRGALCLRRGVGGARWRHTAARAHTPSQYNWRTTRDACRHWLCDSCAG